MFKTSTALSSLAAIVSFTFSGCKPSESFSNPKEFLLPASSSVVENSSSLPLYQILDRAGQTPPVIYKFQISELIKTDGDAGLELIKIFKDKEFSFKVFDNKQQSHVVLITNNLVSNIDVNRINRLLVEAGNYFEYQVKQGDSFAKISRSLKLYSIELAAQTIQSASRRKDKKLNKFTFISDQKGRLFSDEVIHLPSVIFRDDGIIIPATKDILERKSI